MTLAEQLREWTAHSREAGFLNVCIPRGFAERAIEALQADGPTLQGEVEAVSELLDKLGAPRGLAMTRRIEELVAKLKK